MKNGCINLQLFYIRCQLESSKDIYFLRIRINGQELAVLNVLEETSSFFHEMIFAHE